MSKLNPKNKAEAYSYCFEDLAKQLRAVGLRDDKKGVSHVLDKIRGLANQYELASMDIELPNDREK
jgi:hypothetical protein